MYGDENVNAVEIDSESQGRHNPFESESNLDNIILIKESGMRSKLSLSSSQICANISSRSPPDDSIIRTTTYEDKIISCEATEDQAKRKKNEDSLLDSLEDPATLNVEDQEELLGSVGQH